MTAFTAAGLLLTVFGLLLLVAVVFSRGSERVGVPVMLLFLALGVLAGEEGLVGLEYESYAFSFVAGTIALVLILFDGGFNTSRASVRRGLFPALLLSTVGVGITASLVAVAGTWIGLELPQAVLLGAVVSSTDAAMVFAVIRGGRIALQERTGRTLELESGMNDAVAVILTVEATQALLSGELPSAGALAWIPVQLVVGGAVGGAFGMGGAWLLRNLRVSSGGLFPVLTLGLALLSFGGATLLQGSGFLAVYVTAVVLGNSELPYASGLRRIHDALAWLSQVTMFLMLGLLVFPSRLLSVAGAGLALALFLAFVARPLAVALCLLPLRYSLRETAYLGWVGLRGAVPIVLATYPVLSGVPGAERLFDTVFFVVAVNALLPGATVRWATRRLGMDGPLAPVPEAALEISSTRQLDGVLLSFHVDDTLLVCDTPIADIPFPDGASVALVVRGRELLAARGQTVLRAGDHVYVFSKPAERAYVTLLFGRPEA